jgi:hypothetical protein
VLVFRDILAVAAAFALRGYLLLPLNLLWMHRYAGISIRDLLFELRGVAGATIVMAVVVLLVKLALLGHVHSAVLLITEIVAGVVAFAVALLLLERALVADVVGLAAQVFPGGARVARLLRLPMVPAGGIREGAPAVVEAESEAEARLRAVAELDPTALAGSDED